MAANCHCSLAGLRKMLRTSQGFGAGLQGLMESSELPAAGLLLTAAR